MKATKLILIIGLALILVGLSFASIVGEIIIDKKISIDKDKKDKLDALGITTIIKDVGDCNSKGIVPVKIYKEITDKGETTTEKILSFTTSCKDVSYFDETINETVTRPRTDAEIYYAIDLELEKRLGEYVSNYDPTTRELKTKEKITFDEKVKDK